MHYRLFLFYFTISTSITIAMATIITSTELSAATNVTQNTSEYISEGRFLSSDQLSPELVEGALFFSAYKNILEEFFKVYQLNSSLFFNKYNEVLIQEWKNNR